MAPTSNVGRPSIKTPELIEEICERLAEGEPVTRIAKDAHMPKTTTIYRWLTEDESFRDMYTQAREWQADTLFDQTIHIADTATYEEVAQARLRIDTRKWAAGKLRPRKYGDKIEVENTGPVPVALAEPMSDEEWEAKHG